ncbi:MAG TPA: prepilin-type N-terminal cleavage/methylation domain-containing protein [Pyrinomonadaceae bacterium]|nr:prepilin-type N-terminal cleavage/methylation domain-containing protein [Pyrinomonadaceae bacterium]
MWTRMLNSHSRSRTQSGERGFSLIEMIVAMVVLMIGLLAVASAISYALAASNRGRSLTNSKMLIVSILEQMETLRNTRELTFEEISNTQQDDSTFTGFPYTEGEFRPVSTVPGPDGIFGTADDLKTTANGPDDTTLARPGVTRQIKITTFSSNPYLKRIEVNLRYTSTAGETKTLTGISYLQDDSHGTYVH